VRLDIHHTSLIEDTYAALGRHGRPKAPTGIEFANHGTLLLDRTFFLLKAHGTLEDSASLVFTSDDYRRISARRAAIDDKDIARLLYTHAGHGDTRLRA
jgi:SIR2-like domain